MARNKSKLESANKNEECCTSAKCVKKKLQQATNQVFLTTLTTKTLVKFYAPDYNAQASHAFKTEKEFVAHL